MSEFEDAGYLVADVTMRNRDDEAQSYNIFDFKLITPSGTITDPSFVTDQTLGSGDLAANGGEVSGRVTWEVGATKGDYYVVWDPPDLSDDARGVWKVTL